MSDERCRMRWNEAMREWEDVPPQRPVQVNEGVSSEKIAAFGGEMLWTAIQIANICGDCQGLSAEQLYHYADALGLKLPGAGR